MTRIYLWTVCAVALVGCHKEPVSIEVGNMTNVFYITNASGMEQTVTLGTNVIHIGKDSELILTNVFTTNPVPRHPTEEWLREYNRTNNSKNATP